MRRKFLVALAVSTAMMMSACASESSSETKTEAETTTLASTTEAPTTEAPTTEEETTEEETTEAPTTEEETTEAPTDEVSSEEIPSEDVTSENGDDTDSDFIGDTDIPDPVKLLGISDAYMIMDMFDEFGMKTYYFVSEDLPEEDKNSLLEMVPDYDGFLNVEDTITKFDDYFSGAGYSSEAFVDDELGTMITYSKEDSEYVVTITYDDVNITYEVKSADSDIEIDFNQDFEMDFDMDQDFEIEMEDLPLE